jgi:tetratricopeptide (TPR) repeat protein
MTIGLVEESSGRYPSSRRWITRGLADVADEPGPDARLVEGELTARYARVLHLQGRDREALPWAQRAVALAERLPDDRTLAYALESLDRCQVALGHVVAEPPTLRSLAIYETHHDLCGQARIHNSLGMRAYFVGDWPAAVDHYRAAEAAYLRAGRTWSAATCQANIAEVLSDQGRMAEAQALLEPAMRVWRGIGAASEVSFGEYLLGRIAARRGDHATATALFSSARSFCESVGEQSEVQLIDALRAEALGLAGRHDDALVLADAVLAEARTAPGVVASVPMLHRVRGAALLALGRVDEAAVALRAGVATAEERGARHDVAFALDLLLRHHLAASPAEEAGWRRERDELATRLGLVLVAELAA